MDTEQGDEGEPGYLEHRGSQVDHGHIFQRPGTHEIERLARQRAVGEGVRGQVQWGVYSLDHFEGLENADDLENAKDLDHAQDLGPLPHRDSVSGFVCIGLSRCNTALKAAEIFVSIAPSIDSSLNLSLLTTNLCPRCTGFATIQEFIM